MHAVTLKATVPGPSKKMEGINSWGGTEYLVNVTPKNFVYAITFDTIIKTTTDPSGDRTKNPPVRQNYRDRLKEYDRRREDEQARRMRRKEAKAQARKKEEEEKAQKLKREEEAKAQADRERVSKAAATAWTEVREGEQWVRDKFAKKLLDMMTDDDSKNALREVVFDLVHHREEAEAVNLGSNYKRVWEGANSLAAAAAVAHALGYCSSLKTLELDCSGMSAESLQSVLQEGVAKSASLTKLTIYQIAADWWKCWGKR